MTESRPGARLADVAAHARVSQATVSRVLNGRAGPSASTRQAVLAALDVLGYERPRRPKETKAGLVGLIMPELSNPIFPAIAQVIEQTLAIHRYIPVLGTQTPGGSTEDDLVEVLIARGVDGIIFVSGLHADMTADHERYAQIAAQGIPFVLVDGYSERISAPFVSADDAAAMEMAVSHLAELGHERVGLALGPERFVPVARKVAGFADAMRRRGLDAGHVEHSLFTLAGGQAAAGALLDRGCTAIVCGSDIMALGAVRGIRARGLSVPEEVSVVGFDDSPMAAFSHPALTTLRKPVEAMGTAAVDALLDEIGGSTAHRAEFLVQPELVLRGSTARAR
ncbi:LacI family DNA-binding transcriptional regulator [Janibacter sp. G349]|jgi:DNA-binding LacI/PurR family transcriptional regulator|uniref:LacI family DNA-binding transcriptional regulator n=1 Tax=Janibacter sp. G349 TaxID=3405424 RepID=UPI003B77C53A